MTDSSQSEVELELYEKIIDMKYSTPMVSRTSSPLGTRRQNVGSLVGGVAREDDMTEWEPDK